MKFGNTRVYNIDEAIQGMRNPCESWDKSDSGWRAEEYETNGYWTFDPPDLPLYYGDNETRLSDMCNKGIAVLEYFGDDIATFEVFCLGDKDKALAQRLIKAGSEQRKFLRQIFVSVDITAPAYWWAEFDTYKVGVTRNSTSLMHRAEKRDFVAEDFETDGLQVEKNTLQVLLGVLNREREEWLKTHKTEHFRAIRQLLPQSYLYTSTVTMNYENVLNMYEQRRRHILKEWSENFVGWVKTLPYAKEFFEEAFDKIER